LPQREPEYNVRVSVRGLVPGEYSIVPWDTRQGRSLGEMRATADNERTLQFTLPQLHNDLALAIRLVAR
jgi:hypothetical protein